MATITVTPAEFRKAARWAKPSGTPPIPILANVRVSVTGSQLVVAWFDWETLLLARVRGQAAVPDQTATVLVPADQLQAALAAADGPGTKGPLEVTVHDGDKVDLVAVAKGEPQRISVGQTADPDAYPKFPDMPPPTGLAMSATFVPAVTQIAGCCSDEPVTPLICAVHFIPGGETLELQGTEQHILAIDQVPFRPAPAGVTGAGFLVPAKMAAKFAKGCEGPVLIGAPSGPGGFALLSDAWHTMVVQTTVGEYPAVRAKVVDKLPAPAAVFTVDAAKLAVVLGEAAGLLDGAVQEMVDAAVADEADERKPVDKRRSIHVEHDGHGMFVIAGSGSAEVFAFHPGTHQELGRWQVAAVDDVDAEAVVCLNPGYLTRVLPPEGPAVVTLSAPFKNVRVTVPGTAYEGVACPIKLTPPVREEVTV